MIEQRKLQRHFIMDHSVIKVKNQEKWKDFPVLIKDMNVDGLKVSFNSDVLLGDEIFLELPVSSNISDKLQLKVFVHRIQHNPNNIECTFQFKDKDQTKEVSSYLQNFEVIEHRRQISKIKAVKDNRQKLRMAIECLINFPDHNSIIGKVLNINQKGFVIETIQQLKINSDYPVNIDLSSISKYSELCLKIKIIWAKQRNSDLYTYGCEIIEQEESVRKILEKIIEHSENFYYRVPPDRQFSKDGKNSFDGKIDWLKKMMNSNIDIKHIKTHSIDFENIKANIENPIGVTQVPLGIAGPLKVNGEYAQGIYYVPFATTEGTLVATYQRGMLAITKSGGADTVVTKNFLHISPVFTFNNLEEAKNFIFWIKNNFEQIKHEAEKTTRYGTFLEAIPYLLGKEVILNCRFDTGDAMGLNMVNIAVNNACIYIQSQVKTNGFYLRCNFSSDKKSSFYNFVSSYGKEVTAGVNLSHATLENYLGTTAEKFYDIYSLGMLGAVNSGMVGSNAHFANGLGAIYTACGQDIAQIVNASCGIFICRKTDEGLYVSVKLPNLVLATIGGGTKIGTNRECLELMDCYGEGKVEKFTEIVAASVLAGDITIHAALSTGAFIKAHEQKRTILSEKK
jgi:hydroxymethylglutaryl-CoA reductase (NADPH)